MKKLILTLALALSIFGIGCTENYKAKQMGGNIRKELPVGEKLVMVTWKEERFWILTRKRQSNEIPQTYTFKQDSPFGVIEGTVTLIER